MIERDEELKMGDRTTGVISQRESSSGKKKWAAGRKLDGEMKEMTAEEYGWRVTWIK